MYVLSFEKKTQFVLPKIFQKYIHTHALQFLGSWSESINEGTT